MWETAAIVLCLYACFLFGAPIVLLQTFRRPLTPLWYVSEGDFDLDARARDYFAEQQPMLERCGYEVTQTLWCDPVAEGMQAYARMMFNPDTLDLAMIMSAVAPVALGYVEFHQEFADGTIINTQNGKMLPQDLMFRPGKHTFWFPPLNDIRELNQHHRDLTRHMGAGKQPVAPPRNAMLELVQQDSRLDYEASVARGLLTLDRATEVVRMTPKGAFLLTCTILWPMGLVLKARRRMKDRRALDQAHGH